MAGLNSWLWGWWRGAPVVFQWCFGGATSALVVRLLRTELFIRHVFVLLFLH